MNFEDVCEKLGLGELLSVPVIQIGGSLHQIWRVKTTDGEHTIKRIDQKNMAVLGDRLMPIENYLAVGQTCSYPAGRLKFINEQPWLIKEWVNGQCLDHINVAQAVQIGQMVRTIHDKKITADASVPRWGAVDLSKWQAVFPYFEPDQMTTLQRWNDMAERAADFFQHDLIISHRDISIYNVVWHQENPPTLIDWEFAGNINRELDVFITALNFDRSLGDVFSAVVDTYGELKTNIDLLFSGYFGYCLDWMDFNIDRLMHYPEQNTIAHEQLIGCFDVLLRVSDNYFLKV